MIKEAGKVIKDQHVLFSFLVLLLITGGLKKAEAQAVAPADKICGKWMSEEKNCIVNVYKSGNEFGAKLMWFNDSDDKSQPMNARTDYKNPDPTLRKRKLIGMEVLENLTYNPATNSWENGIIYDAKSGHKWSSAASLAANNTNILKVTGYWHFKFLGKTMTFNRM
ncbi:DUF2147 domain-containing protein [Mucilaginibacter arboris]|uniref:DUF2147 domain-containing protein n=1 Tax=Mucilaginibacter arboris TaxID=2682090 RepID=A0A7K1T1D7_9SPHI|nr:DUF2147 domain-containing protein [Mucilaginibacter arboris]MVN23337.1 DUF2147 domain-containing protein [Mucilaginibacter arboris]